MDKTDSQAARELALDVYGGDPAKLERTYEAYQMFSRSAASAIRYRKSTANILARADSADEPLRNCFLRYEEAGTRSQSDTQPVVSRHAATTATSVVASGASSSPPVKHRQPTKPAGTRYQPHGRMPP